MIRSPGIVLLVVFVLGIGCAERESPSSTFTGTPVKSLKIGYVLHGLNDFTQVIKKGAEDAGRALQVDVAVNGPGGFKTPEGIAMFEGMVQQRKDGLAVVPMPGATWVRPIAQAVDAGIPVVTANFSSPESKANGWFGQHEYKSGVLLGGEVRKMLEGAGATSGKIVIGICVPGETVLTDRYKGVKKAFEGSAFSVTDPFDVKVENTANYAQWENLASANRDMVAAIGLCSMDIPNMAKVKKRSGGKWLIAGYDLNLETLDAIKSGTAQITAGQHPYLQGYLPVLALTRHLRDGKPLVKGWIDVGTELVTRENVDSVYDREANEETETKWYAEHVEKNFADLNALEKPMPKAGDG